jgi:hypothetical protein
MVLLLAQKLPVTSKSEVLPSLVQGTLPISILTVSMR